MNWFQKILIFLIIVFALYCLYGFYNIFTSSNENIEGIPQQRKAVGEKCLTIEGKNGEMSSDGLCVSMTKR